MVIGSTPRAMPRCVGPSLKPTDSRITGETASTPGIACNRATRSASVRPMKLAPPRVMSPPMRWLAWSASLRASVVWNDPANTPSAAASVTTTVSEA